MFGSQRRIAVQLSMQANGRHERMHRTLKRETATPPAFTLKEQQDRFDEFRRCFNRERPHEALAFKTPDSVYVASTRAYPLALQKITYGDEFEVRTVRKEGDIKWQGANIFISEVLRHESVGLRQMCVWPRALAHLWPSKMAHLQSVAEDSASEASRVGKKGERNRRSCVNVGIARCVRDFQGRWKRCKTGVWFCTVSTDRHLHSFLG